MGLGAGSATPLQMAAAYSIFANGGYRVAPYLIAKSPMRRATCCRRPSPSSPARVPSARSIPRNAFVMTSLLRDVIAFGTATRAQSLGRKDLAGKTGTTNDNVDAWFCGYNSDQVGVAWIGYDQPQDAGRQRDGRRGRACRSGSATCSRRSRDVPETPAGAARRPAKRAHQHRNRPASDEGGT